MRGGSKAVRFLPQFQAFPTDIDIKQNRSCIRHLSDRLAGWNLLYFDLLDFKESSYG